jgi:hypothetical protein
VGTTALRVVVLRRMLALCSSGIFSSFRIRIWLPAHKLELFVQGDSAERWRQLCEQAAIEHDPEKLMKLIAEITRLLDEKRERLSQTQKPSDAQVA